MSPPLMVHAPPVKISSIDIPTTDAPSIYDTSVDATRASVLPPSIHPPSIPPPWFCLCVFDAASIDDASIDATQKVAVNFWQAWMEWELEFVWCVRLKTKETCYPLKKEAIQSLPYTDNSLICLYWSILGNDLDNRSILTMGWNDTTISSLHDTGTKACPVLY